MRKLIPFIAVISLISLASCGTGAKDLDIEAPSTNTSIPSTATESPTNTPFPTLTSTELPTPTLPSVATSHDVPEWLGNLDNTVIMTITSITDNSNQLTFFNANTQERYDISLPITNLSHYFWTTDGKSFGFLSRDRTTVFLVSTTTGVMSKYPLSEKASKCLQEYFDYRGEPENKHLLSNMWVYDTSPESEIFFCEPFFNSDFPDVNTPSGFSSPIVWSKDYRFYLAQSLVSENQGLPCVINLEGNIKKCLSAIDEKYYGSGLDLFRWSKNDDQIYYTQTDAPMRTDLCIYNLITDDVTCSSEKIVELDGYNIEYYVMSDDEQYFEVLYGSSCSACDFWGEPSSVVFRRDGANVLFMGKELKEPNTSWAYPFFSSLFRPSQ